MFQSKYIRQLNYHIFLFLIMMPPPSPPFIQWIKGAPRWLLGVTSSYPVANIIDF